MKHKKTIFLQIVLLACCVSALHAAGLENRTITITSNERFDLVNGSSIQFKFQPLTDEARALEITKNASSLGVAYLGQVQVKENVTALSALRSIADQIGESLDLSFGVIADSNTSEALKTNELLLLYHPNVTITLALVRPNKQSHYEIICTYALKELKVEESNTNQAKIEDSKPKPISSVAEPVTDTIEEAVEN